jgi:cell division protein FtsI (penicillin-binding protein 3)
MFHIQLVEGEMWRARAEEISTQLIKVRANRGNILANDESFLAVSVPVYDLRMDTYAEGITPEIFNREIDSLSISLATLFKDKSASKYKEIIRKGRKEKNRYLLLQRNITAMQLDKVKKFPLFRMGKNKGGLIAEQKSKRIKPYGNLAARTIGKEDGESQGIGLEKAYDEYLRGEEGLRLMEKLSGNIWRPLDTENTVDPVDGFDVYTTIDPRIQDVAESELERQLSLHNAGYGCVALMEVSTGDIKAIANLKRAENGKYYESYNYVIGEASEPGSTLKLATMIALLEDGMVKLDDKVETGNGEMRFFNHTLTDSKKGGHGTITVQHAFEVSSNIAMAKLVFGHYKNDPQQFIDHFKRMHLDRPLGIEIPGEATPRVKNKTDKDWSGLTLPMMSIGYECLVTPLQILTLYNAVANNGKMMKPRFVKEIRNRGKVVKTIPPTVLEEKICSDKTLRDCKTLLEGVVENGTATNLKNTVYKIAGKTGTAVIANNNKGYRSPSGKIYRASFCGYFPADNPKYTCIVVVNAPSNNVYYGNVVAGPIFRAVADKVYASAFDINQNYYVERKDQFTNRIPQCKDGFAEDLKIVLNKLNISSKLQNEVSDGIVHAVSASNCVEMYAREISYDKMPDVRGMGARDALFLLEKIGLQVRMKGKGVVRYQSVEPGTPISQIAEVTIELS